MEAVATESDAENGHRRVTAVLTEAAARNRRHTADAYVLATGGILGGGIVGSEGDGLAEVVFGLPVAGPVERSDWLRPEFTDPAGHPVYRSGVAVDAELRPVDPGGSILRSNLHAAGGILAGADPIAERSVDGIALATGRRAGLLAARSASQRLEGVDSL
jgi:glycerol-3-phosphate dehydrogenase subunit B